MQLKPWLTPGILNSIKIRDRLFVKFKNAKDKERKLTLHASFKTYRNTIVDLLRQSKKKSLSNLLL